MVHTNASVQAVWQLLKSLLGLALSEHMSLGTLPELWGIPRLHIHDEANSRYLARLPAGLEDPSKSDLGSLPLLVYVSRCLSKGWLKIASTLDQAIKHLVQAVPYIPGFKFAAHMSLLLCAVPLVSWHVTQPSCLHCRNCIYVLYVPQYALQIFSCSPHPFYIYVFAYILLQQLLLVPELSSWGLSE